MKHHKSIQHPIISIVVFLFFVLFMFPFGMVILNSAKTSKEIINNAMGMPESWGQLFANVKAIFTNESVNYISAFFDSSAITIITLAVIVVFSSMCAWVLFRFRYSCTRWYAGCVLWVNLCISRCLEPCAVSCLPILALAVRFRFLYSMDLSKTSPMSWKRLQQ